MLNMMPYILKTVFTEPIKTTDDILGEELHCRTCLLSFSGLEDYRFHYKEDLHRYNLKLKINGKPAISQEQFCEIEDGISSISGSDSEDDKSTVSKFSVGSPKVYFQNDSGQKMAVYRCLLYPNKKVTIFTIFLRRKIRRYIKFSSYRYLLLMKIFLVLSQNCPAKIYGQS